MVKLKIKPLSVNAAWRGKRFKTHAYNDFELEMLALIPKQKIPDGNLHVTLEFGFSNKNSDLDNPTKLTIDCLQKRLGFNDNRIYLLTLHKTIVKKGDEFIRFDIKPTT